ncbi:MAG: hypothetical protein Q7R45_05605, partial [Sulfuricaulis sp.]|nr:hypothetical protein [Sulfuricaulis sp.]
DSPSGLDGPSNIDLRKHIPSRMQRRAVICNHCFTGNFRRARDPQRSAERAGLADQVLECVVVRHYP